VTNKTNPENFGAGGGNDDDDDNNNNNDDYHHHHHRRRKFKRSTFCHFMNCINGFSFWQ
jgi:hypothetical protein